jgi:hypothetical protein
MALVLANLALHIISTTGGSGSRGKPKGSSTDLTPWRPWAIQLLTEVCVCCVRCRCAGSWGRNGLAEILLRAAVHMCAAVCLAQKMF